MSRVMEAQDRGTLIRYSGAEMYRLIGPWFWGTGFCDNFSYNLIITHTYNLKW